MVIYQPQVDDWKNFLDLTWRAAFELTPAGGKAIVGAATFEGTTDVNTDTHMVTIYGLQVLNTYFPGARPGSYGAAGSTPQIISSSADRQYLA